MKTMTLQQIEQILGKELMDETIQGIKSGKSEIIDQNWEHDQQAFDDLCANLGYTPYFFTI